MKTKKEQKTAQKRWVKKRHAVIFAILQPIFYVFFKLRYNFTVKNEESITPKPCLIMSNHLTTLDPFMLSKSFRRPLYFITSDDLFTIPVLSRLIRFLVAPIPKSKSKSDLNTIRFTLKVLKEGGSVAVFPEGNRSLSGGPWGIDISTAKFAKLAKVPLVLYKLQGGYGADPRWGKGVRKGKATGSIVKIIPTEELAKMSVEEVYQEIVSTLVSDDYLQGEEFFGKNRAEFLERALYRCPSCGGWNTLHSKKHTLSCKNCSFETEYMPNLTFRPVQGELPYPHVKEWFDEQRLALKEYAKNAKNDEVLFFDEGLEARKIVNRRKRIKLGLANMQADKNGVTIRLKDESIRLEFSQLVGATVLGKRKINFYLPDGNTLQLKGSERFNSVKYLHLFEFEKADTQTTDA